MSNGNGASGAGEAPVFTEFFEGSQEAWNLEEAAVWQVFREAPNEEERDRQLALYHPEVVAEVLELMGIAFGL